MEDLRQRMAFTMLGERLERPGILTICGYEGCEKLRIEFKDPKDDYWMSRVEKPELYDSAKEKFSNGSKREISFSLCPPHAKEIME